VFRADVHAATVYEMPQADSDTEKAFSTTTSSADRLHHISIEHTQ
jgi:hypothetical protein